MLPIFRKAKAPQDPLACAASGKAKAHQDPLACAASGKAKVLGELLKGFDEEDLKNIRDDSRDGNSILSTAAFYGHVECCKVIIEKCPSLLYNRNEKDCTALHLAASENRTVTLRYLLDAAAKNDDVEGKTLLTMKDKEGCTALHLAAQSGHVGAVKVLIEADVDGKLLSMVDKNEDTAMHLAVAAQRKEIVEILAKRKPDLEYSANKSGQTPHFIAFEKAVSGVPTAEAIKKIILQLPERVNEHGQNFLHILSSTSKHDEEKYSLGLKDIDPIILNKQDKKGNTPLHVAVENKNENLAKALLYNKDVLKTVKNHDGDLAIDKITFQYDTKKAGTFGIAKEEQQQAIAEIYKMQDQQVKDRVKDQANVDLVVTTLIATVSFAAGIAVPGGYTGEGSNIGTAILTPKTSFKVFIVSDVIALWLSLFAVLCHLTAKHIQVAEPLLYRVKIAGCCSILAIFAMVVAFASGVYVVLAVTDEFAKILCALFSSSFVLLGLLLLYRMSDMASRERLCQELLS